MRALLRSSLPARTRVYTPYQLHHLVKYCGASDSASYTLQQSRKVSGRLGSTKTSSQHRVPAQVHDPSLLGRRHIRADFGLISIPVLLLGAAALYYASQPQAIVKLEPQPAEEEMVDAGFAEVAAGRPGNLTAEQEDKLRQLWAALFKVTGVGHLAEAEEQLQDAAADAVADSSQQQADPNKTAKKKRRSLFSKKNKESDLDALNLSPKRGSPTTPKDGDADDKYGQNKEFYETLATSTPESIRATVWSMVKHDHPDALLLRFLRARKWDVDRALVMLVSTMHWRASEMHVDDDIMKNGEFAAFEAEKGPDGPDKTLGHDFLNQIRMGKSFVHGVDKSGRPICVVRVRLHHQGDQSVEAVERSTVFIIETTRMLLRTPVDTATIVFDMSHFSMANMDYTPVKFMIKCFEANYPECLGSVLVHRSPWIFQGIWKIIRGWLDPVVASKVHFTNNLKDVEEFIAPNRVLKELDGQEDWSFQYVEPQPGENDKMKDTATRDKLAEARESLYEQYEEATLQWIASADQENATAIKAQRESLAKQLSDDYWTLDPYIRARSFYDRVGVLRGKEVDFYPTAATPAATTNGASHPETSADDVD